MEWLYRLGTGAYHAGLGLAARAGNARAREWVRGRAEDATPPPKGERQRLWVHAASVGEWEQGRPVVALWKHRRPDVEVVLTFFSPSGFTQRREDELVDHVRYLPYDTPAAAEEWVAGLRPDLAIFIKYEFWFYHLRALDRAGVPTFLVAGGFRRTQLFFNQFLGGFHRRMLRLFDGIAVQDEDSYHLVRYGVRFPAERLIVSGDPRIDRVQHLARSSFADPVLEAFSGGEKLTLIAGSVWPEDLKVWRAAWPSLRARYRVIFAPHHLDQEQVARSLVQWEGLKYSSGSEVLTPARLRSHDVLFLDTMGLLSRAYRYADVAYVGGAFRTGLHNTLEPLAYGLPVVFGPNHGKFPEAGAAIKAGGAFSVDTPGELAEVLGRLAEEGPRHAAGLAQRKYLEANAGAARRTVDFLAGLVTVLLLVVGVSLPVGGVDRRGGSGWEAFGELAQDQGSGWKSSAQSPQDALNRAFAKANLLLALTPLDWHPDLALTATHLDAGETLSLAVPVRAGERVAFVASAPREDIDVDLYLRDRRGKLLADDDEPDGTPVLEYTSPGDDTVYVQLHLVAAFTPATPLALALLTDRGRPLTELRYRALTKRFFATAGTLLTDRPGYRYGTTGPGWTLFLRVPTETGEMRLGGIPAMSAGTVLLGVSEPAAENGEVLLLDSEGRMIGERRGKTPVLELPTAGQATVWGRNLEGRASIFGFFGRGE